MQLEEMKKLSVISSDVRKVAFDETVADLLGEDYKKWNTADVIFISASTGLGKTYWVMNVLYEYAYNKGEKVAIFLNRRILKDQVFEDARMHEWRRNRDKVGLYIFSYQQLEAGGESAETIQNIVRGCRYVICDECHYFLSDALFNPKVQKSFDFLTELYYHTTLIFVSATIEKVRELIEKRIVDLYNQRFVDWKERLDDEWWYKKSGKKRSLEEYIEIMEENGAPFRTYEECEIRGDGPTVPHVRFYDFYRNLKENVRVHHFRMIEELAPLVTNGQYFGKWLVFVADKKSGKKLQEMIEENGSKKSVYIDSDLIGNMANGDGKDDPAYSEIRNIRKCGKFNCDVLITTSVLDNGVNIKDPDVKNIVLITDDEVEFKQMLGRKRFLAEDEVVEVFISCGVRKDFVMRDRGYYNVYWMLCDNPGFSPMEALKLAAKDGFNKLSYYNTNEYGWFHSNELTIRAAWLRGLFCNEMAGRMLVNEDAFLDKQLEWMGLDYTAEWKETESVAVSPDEVEKALEVLRKRYDEWSFFNKDGLDEIWSKLFSVVSKSEPKRYKNFGSVRIATVNEALSTRSEWSAYQIKSLTSKGIGTVYELVCNGRHRCEIDCNITLEQLSVFLKKGGVGIGDVVSYLFHDQMIGLNDAWMTVYVNEKMKESNQLKEYMLKTKRDNDNKEMIAEIRIVRRKAGNEEFQGSNG